MASSPMAEELHHAVVEAFADASSDPLPRIPGPPGPGLASPCAELDLRRGFRSEQERGRVLDWLDAGLRPGRPGRLSREYPLLFERPHEALHHTLFRRERPVAHCVLWPRTLRLRGLRLRVGLLSLVFTDPDARGRGHAGELIRAAVETAQNVGLGLILLWSEADALYAREGFEPAGTESLLMLDRATLERALQEARLIGPSLAVGAAAPVAIDANAVSDLPAIARLRSRRDAALELSESELQRLCTIPELEVRVARRAGRTVAFAMCGRGDDLRDVIHEWGGEVEATLLCCHALLTDSDRDPDGPLGLLAPGTRSDLSWCCRRVGAPASSRPLAWMRIASFGHLCEDLGPNGLGGRLSGLVEGATACATAPGRTQAGLVSQGDLLEALFGRAGTEPSDRVSRLRTELSSEEPDQQPLPLPLFLSGLESI